jgi:DNA adenine methylase
VKSGPIKRHGGKCYLAPKIRALFPNHTRYVETHFGGGSVMLYGDGEGVAEYANDLDKDLSNFWDVLKIWAHYVQFKQRCEATPFSKKVFRQAQERLRQPWVPSAAPASLDDVIDRAWAFFTVARQSRQGLGKDFATPTSRLRRGMNEQVSAWLSAVEGLPEFHARLKRVEIRCEDACGLIKELDSPETLFYCDPPYLHSTRSSTGEYHHEMTADDHSELLVTLEAIKGKFLLSGYRSKIYDEHAEAFGWPRVDFVIDNKASSAKVKEKKTECIWLNY